MSRQTQNYDISLQVRINDLSIMGQWFFALNLEDIFYVGTRLIGTATHYEHMLASNLQYVTVTYVMVN